MKVEITAKEKAQCVNWYNQTGSLVGVQRRFRATFKSRYAPPRSIILLWVKKFTETGDLSRKQRDKKYGSGAGAGHPACRLEAVAKLFDESPTVSVRTAARILNLSVSTIARAAHHLKLHPYKDMLKRTWNSLEARLEVLLQTHGGHIESGQLKARRFSAEE